MIQVRGAYITRPVIQILYDIQGQLRNGKLAMIYPNEENIKVTCPFHSGGHEHKPSCYVRATDGVVHCFACGTSCGFIKFVAACFDRDITWAENWLMSRYVSEVETRGAILPKLQVHQPTKVSFLDEAVLDSFEPYHPYMAQRKLSADIIKKFKIKYDPATECIVFPVRDRYGRLKYLTRRSVSGKRFIIDKCASKSDIYLLDSVLYEDTVIVCESQINALTCWTYGRPAISLLGAGTTQEQMNELNKTGIKRFVLAYDPDPAGEKGAQRFMSMIDKSKVVIKLNLPSGRDINDLSKEEFDKMWEEQVVNYSRLNKR